MCNPRSEETRHTGYQVPIMGGGQMSIIGVSDAHYWGIRSPLSGGQVPIARGTGADCRGVKCPL